MELLILGKIVWTLRIFEDVQTNSIFNEQVKQALNYHRTNQFDKTTLCAEDIEFNKQALTNGDRILNSFSTCKGTIWIITESDRSETTILYPDEY
ncbi:MAG: hypothetical protein ACK5I7_08630 [Anaerotignum sp.]